MIKRDVGGGTFSVLATAYFEELFDVLDLFRHFELEVRNPRTQNGDVPLYEVICLVVRLPGDLVVILIWGSHSIPSPSYPKYFVAPHLDIHLSPENNPSQCRSGSYYGLTGLYTQMWWWGCCQKWKPPKLLVDTECYFGQDTQIRSSHDQWWILEIWWKVLTWWLWKLIGGDSEYLLIMLTALNWVWLFAPSPKNVWPISVKM